MRRKNFSWNGKQGNFIPTISKAAHIEREAAADCSKTEIAIKLFSQRYEAKEVAQQLGFQDHRELYDYLASEGCLWDAKLGNYRRREEEVTANFLYPVPDNDLISSSPTSDIAELISYLPLLRMLQKREDQLNQLLNHATT